MSQQPNLEQEQRLWALGYRRIAGLDEAGRGAWAGPVVAAAVVLPSLERCPSLMDVLCPVRDSKLLSPLQRERCFDLVVQTALDYGVGSVAAPEIDLQGIVPSTRKAMECALLALSTPPDYLMIDALALPDVPIPQFYRPKGDRYCLSIAAASIIAKVTRDRQMVELDGTLPGYGLARHKGYGTPQHRGALASLGTTSFHRHSYAPIRALDEQHEA